MEVVLIQVPFPNNGSKQKNKNEHTESSYHSKVRSTQNMGVPLFPCFGHGV